MGYYIETGGTHNKAEWLVNKHGATKITRREATELIADPDYAVICVVNNFIFEAMALVFDADELAAFTEPDDKRPKSWLRLEKAKAHELAGYNQPATA